MSERSDRAHQRTRETDDADATVVLPAANPVLAPIGHALHHPDPVRYACQTLPPAGPFCAMMNGRWPQDRCRPRYVRTGAPA